MIKGKLFLLLGLLLLAALLPVKAEEAKDITNKCVYSLSINRNQSALMRDGKYKTFWNSEKRGSLEITTPQGQPCSALYIHWMGNLADWRIEIQNEAGEWIPIQDGPEEKYYNQYVILKEGLEHFRIACISPDIPMQISEIQVFTSGEVLSGVQTWEPFSGKADLMVLVAHPDDELLFMGGVIPYYNTQEGKRVIVCYIANTTGTRKSELLDGLWHCGVREYPALPPSIFLDKFTSSVKSCLANWNEEQLLRYITVLIRKYQPDVIVTHDIAGEYGHGAHRTCAYALRKCIEKTGNADYFSDSAEQYGVWQAKKLYLHLFQGELGQIDFDWRQPLSAFDGKTAYDITCEAFKKHVTQNGGKYQVEDFGRYDNSLFGLYYSSVGADTGKNDFFENIP